MIGRTQAVALAVFFGAIAFAPLIAKPFQLTILTSMGLYALLTLSVCAIVSYAGQFALLQAVSASVAGYIVGIGIVSFGMPFWSVVLLGLAGSMLIAAGISTFIFRLRGFYLGIGTLLVTLVVPLIEAIQFEKLTAGYFGLKIPPGHFQLGPIDLEDRNVSYFAMWIAVALVSLFFADLERSRIIRAARAVKANQAAAQLAAIDPTRVKVGMFLVSAFVASIAGILGTSAIGYIDPFTYDISLIIVIFAAAIIGGRGSFWGALIGAVFITATNQFFQSIGEKATLAFGLLLVVILIAKPDGLLGFGPTIARFLRRRPPPVLLARVVVEDPVARADGPVVSTGRSILELDRITVRFDAFTAVDDVSLSIGEGKIVALLGPNGAGKTTIFNAVTGYDPPSSGRIRFAGADITSRSTYQIRRAGISRTLQIPHAFGELTTWENIALGADYLYGNGILSSGLALPGARRNEREVRHKAIALATRVGLAEMSDRKASQLSFGQTRLVDIARAMAGTCRLLLLDEPFAGLSQAMIGTVKDLLLDLRGRGYTILLIDHNFEHVSSICSEGFLLVGGKLSRAGRIADLLHDEVVIRQYVGV